jgi:peptidoglycan-N-acetylglucosamine deacetylase
MNHNVLPSAIVICLLISASGAIAAGPMPGDHLKPFALTNGDGQLVEWKPGRVSVLSFCAFWCDTWKEQSSRLERCQRSLSGQPIDFVTVSVDGRWAERCKGKAGGTVLLDLQSALAHRLGINRIPYTLVVDAGGVIRYAAEGIMREASVTDTALSRCGILNSASAKHPTTGAGTIYLTFDDFPCTEKAESTTPAKGPDERLLDVLRESRVSATFFCICNRLEESRGVIERAAKEGHSLQIHSWDHNGDHPQIDRCTRTIKGMTGIDPALYRPPGSEKCLELHGPTAPPSPVINPYDYTRPGKDEIKRRILLGAKPGCVILLHAGVSDTIDALPDVIRSLRSRGFGFGILRW